MNARARIFAYILAPVALACASCAPAPVSAPDPAAATAPTGPTAPPVATALTAVAESIDGTMPEIPYPPPMQTEKSAEATDTVAREGARETAMAVGVDEPIDATDMVQYANPVLGLAFAYPGVLGEVEFEVRPGETGEAWRLGFSRFDALSLEGVTPDYSEGRGGMAGDTYGYTRSEDGGMRWLYVPSRPDGSEIEVEEVVTSESGTEIAVFVPPTFMGALDDATPGPPAALVNLAGDRFPGLIVINRQPERLPAETLRAILQTIEVTEPTQTDVATATPAEG